MKLNIGCGKDWKEFWPEYEGLDIVDFGQKFVCNIEKKGIPAPRETFDGIRAWNVLEHISPEKVIYVMNECHRVLIKGGVMHIKVPRTPHENAFSDPTHKSFWTVKTFTYYFAGKSPRNADYGIVKWGICNNGQGHYILEVDDRSIDIKLYKR